MGPLRWTPTRLFVGLALTSLVVSSGCGAVAAGGAEQLSPSVTQTPSAEASSVATPAPSTPTPSTLGPSTPAPSTPAASTPAVPTATPTQSASPTSTATSTTSTSPEPSASATPKPPARTPSVARPAALLERGDHGTRVRELQHRLRQLNWYSGRITGSYGAATVRAVDGFQTKRKLDDTGEVDQATWDTLTTMTTKPSRDDLYNVVRAGRAILQQGDDGDRVRDLQARLKQLDWYSGKVTGHYGSATVSSVKGFQDKRSIPVTGEVDQRTWDRLTARTHTPSRNEKLNLVPKPSAAALDPRCMTGRVLCVSKRTDELVWVIDGKPQLKVDVRFGSRELPTRNGSFKVEWKSRNHVSSIYHTSMPYAMFFSRGQAVHYSRDFAARGYAGASHGCVNVRDKSAIRHLFDTVRVGDKVVVYR